MTDTFFALFRCLCVRDRSFLMGKGEGPGGIRPDAPIVYNDPPLHKTFWRRLPLYPKLIEMTSLPPSPPPPFKKRKKRKKERERTKKKMKND